MFHPVIGVFSSQDIDYDIDSDEEWEEEQAILKEGEIDDCSEEEMSEVRVTRKISDGLTERNTVVIARTCY